MERRTALEASIELDMRGPSGPVAEHEKAEAARARAAKELKEELEKKPKKIVRAAEEKDAEKDRVKQKVQENDKDKEAVATERARPATEETQKKKISKDDAVDASVSGKRKALAKPLVPWRPVKSPLPGPGTYSIDRSKPSNVHNHGHWSLGSRRSVDRLYMPQYPEKDMCKTDTPFYETESSSNHGQSFSKDGRNMVQTELITTPSGMRPLTDFRQNRTPCCTTYGGDPGRSVSSPKYSFGKADRGAGGVFQQRRASMVGPGTYTPNEVLTTRRVKYGVLGASWATYDNVRTPGDESLKFLTESPAHEYTPNLDASLKRMNFGGRFSRARTGRAAGTSAPGSPKLNTLGPGPALENVSELHCASTRFSNPAGGSWAEPDLRARFAVVEMGVKVDRDDASWPRKWAGGSFSATH
jgi:hypothetical protein